MSDFGAEGGGSLIKDHLFFFGAIDPSWDSRTQIAPPGLSFPLNALGAVDRDRHTLSYSAKGTFQLTSAHRIDASFFGDPSTGLNGPQRASALLNQNTAGFSSLTYGGHNQTVRYSGVLSNRFLVEANYARALNDINELPSVNQWEVTDRTVTPNVVSGGIGFYEAGNRSVNDQFAAKATSIFGGHQIKCGGESRQRDLQQHQPVHRPHLHGAQRRDDGDRRADSDHSRRDVRRDFPRRARRLQPRPDDDAEIRQLLRAGHVESGTG